MGQTVAKPYADFPLFLHTTGQWAKKICGRTHYFGTDADAALKKYTAERDDLYAGRSPRREPDRITLRDLVNRFLTAKKNLVESGELSVRTWSDYLRSYEHLARKLGKTRFVDDLDSLDFERLRKILAKRRGPVALGNEIQRIRTLFKFAFEDGLIEKPVRFGASFKKPSRKVMRKARHEAGPRMFEASDVRLMLEHADQPLRAMILLGVNCGFGQSDLANLPLKAVDLKQGWINYPRPKTGVPRRCPLWPETLKALKHVVAHRPNAKAAADADLVFITKYGARFVRTRQKREGRPVVPIDAIQNEFQKLLDALGINRHGLGFYALRHTFRTIADASKDQPAIDHIMGHARDDMADSYRERIDDDRLQAVVKQVRDWLLADSSRSHQR